MKNLEEVKKKLKSDFVGLDEIIDRVIDLISPWYLTPDILERPIVISLLGLTGTGKTSLIKRLVNLLEISDRTKFFDCGEIGRGGEGRGSGRFSDELQSLFENTTTPIQESDYRYSEEELKELRGSKQLPEGSLRSVFVFDEFQYLKSKNPMTGEEDQDPASKAVWELIDSGRVDINNSNYHLTRLQNFVEDMEFFITAYPDVKLDNMVLPKELNKILKNQISYYRWSEGNFVGGLEEARTKGENGFQILESEELNYMSRKLNMVSGCLGFRFIEDLKQMKDLGDAILYIKKYVGLISKPIMINCSQSLIFILGNIDEAFDLTGDDLDPDIDADVYHDYTSKISTMDMKVALRKRFRDEQIGRLGNNLIIYPSLTKRDFRVIIERELDRICKKFKDNHGVEIEWTDKFKDLVYSEGVFPIQGCRPIFSTISYLTSPVLSCILQNKPAQEKAKVEVEGDSYNVPQILVYVEGMGGTRIGEKTLKLNLGELRSPDRCKKIGLQSVHEASHAVLYYVLTGEIPQAIISSNVFGNGGYMMHEICKDFSVTTEKEMRDSIMTGLAGYFGERAFFEERHCSLGSGSDIEQVWKELRTAFYEEGLYVPLRFSEKGTSQENFGLPFGMDQDKEDLGDELYSYFQNLCSDTKRLVGVYKVPIAKVADRLIELRSMGSESFLAIMRECGVEPNNDKPNWNEVIWKISRK